MKRRIRSVLVFLLLSCMAVATTAQDMPPSGGLPAGAAEAIAAAGPDAVAAAVAAGGPAFGLGLNLGYATILTGDRSTSIGWQKIALQPDLGVDAFGVGINLDLHFRFNGGDDGQTFEIRKEDWQVTSFPNFLEVYLPKIRYVRLGQKGLPLYLLLGNVENGLLGNGFIVGGYNNTLFQPGQRVFGMNFDLDGAVFDFPFIGIETMVGNLAAWDLMAARIYFRPGAKSGLAAFEGTQFGITFAADFNPHYYAIDGSSTNQYGKDTVFIGGADIKQPIVTEELFNLSAYIDGAIQNNQVEGKNSFGGQIGFNGTIVKFLTYNAAIRFNGDNFIPSYFDSTYDLMRMQKYAVFSSQTVVIKQATGWLASLGFSVMNGSLIFNATVDGPFVVDTYTPYQNPNLKIILALKEGIIEGLSLSALYDKKNITQAEDIVDPTNAKIGALIGYKLGPAKISLVYDVTYDEHQTSGEKWKVTSHLETSIVLF